MKKKLFEKYTKNKENSVKLTTHLKEFNFSKNFLKN